MSPYTVLCCLYVKCLDAIDDMTRIVCRCKKSFVVWCAILRPLRATFQYGTSRIPYQPDRNHKEKYQFYIFSFYSYSYFIVNPFTIYHVQNIITFNHALCLSEKVIKIMTQFTSYFEYCVLPKSQLTSCYTFEKSWEQVTGCIYNEYRLYQVS